MTTVDQDWSRLVDAPELAAYQDQPAQYPAGSVGKNAYLRLGFEARRGRTELTDLYRVAPLLVQQALYWDEAMPELACVTLVSTAGGVLQGDRQTVEMSLGERTRVHVTTQSATRIQEMDANYATLDQRITLGEESYLEFLPDPTIPYRGSRYAARTRVTLPASATLLYADVLLPGRTHYHRADRFAYDVYSTSFEAARPAGGGPLCAEKFVIEPARDTPSRLGVLNGYRVLGTVFLLTPPEHAAAVLAATPPVLDRDSDIAAGAGVLPHGAGVVYRVLGMESEPVRAAVRGFWSTAREQVMKRPVPPAFRWR